MIEGDCFGHSFLEAATVQAVFAVVRVHRTAVVVVVVAAVVFVVCVAAGVVVVVHLPLGFP